VALKQGKEALELLEQKLKDEPDNAGLLTMKASLLRSMGKEREAIDTARRIILRDQKNIEAMKIIGLAYADMNKFDLAETFFLNALNFAPDDMSLNNNIALMQFKRGDPRKALETYSKTLAKNPSDPIANVNVGLIALRYRDFERTATSLKRAIDQGMKNCLTYKALGYAFEGRKAGQDAIKSFESALALCPSEVELLYDMAQIYLAQLRDTGSAKDTFKRYLAQKGIHRADLAKQALDSIKMMEEAEAQMAAAQKAAPPPESNTDVAAPPAPAPTPTPEKPKDSTPAPAPATTDKPKDAAPAPAQTATPEKPKDGAATPAPAKPKDATTTPAPVTTDKPKDAAPAPAPTAKPKDAAPAPAPTPAPDKPKDGAAAPAPTGMSPPPPTPAPAPRASDAATDKGKK
jgi:tetratricopeptide (TPR) repeat protein